MRYDFFTRIKTATAVAPALLAAGAAFSTAARGQEAPAPAGKAEPKAAPKTEIVSGVILKAEKLPGADAGGRAQAGPPRIRLTINPNAVWRDWARDQARVRDAGSPKADAEKGAKSVAVAGQPADENNVAIVDVVDATRVETRFRSPSDETTRGETSPEKVKDEGGATSKAAPKGKPVRFRAEDLLPGLFVEAEFRAVPGRDGRASDPATTVVVIRPIEPLEAPGTPAPGNPPK